MSSWSEAERAYWAGLVDGEFHIRWTSSPLAQLCTTDFSIVDSLANIYSVKSWSQISNNISWKDSKRVHLSGNNCRNFLSQVRPYLLIKDRQADIILNREDNPKEKLMILNKRGVNHELREPKDIIWTPERYSYYAGLTDGEGCISGSIRPQFRYTIQMCDPGAIYPLSLKYSVMLSKVCRPKRYSRDIYQIQLCSNNLKSFLIELQPYLRLKKPQATLILNCGMSKEEELKVIEKIKILNHKGKTLE